MSKYLAGCLERSARTLALLGAILTSLAAQAPVTQTQQPTPEPSRPAEGTPGGPFRRPQLTPEEVKQQFEAQKPLIDAAIPNTAPVKPKRPRTLLVMNLNVRNGEVVPGPESPVSVASADYMIEQLGKRTGAWQTVVSNDVENFRRDKIKRFDAIVFMDSMGSLTDDPELRQSLLSFITEGGGIVAIHAAIDTFVQVPNYDIWPVFPKILGATENGGHPWQREPMTMRVEDPSNPLNAGFKGESTFVITDQAFQFQEPTLRDHLHVLISIDAEKTGITPTTRILPQRQQDHDFPMSWIRRYEKGRVFFCGIGHNATMFSNPPLVQHYLAGIQYAIGDLQADDRPSAPSASESGR